MPPVSPTAALGAAAMVVAAVMLASCSTNPADDEPTVTTDAAIAIDEAPADDAASAPAEADDAAEGTETAEGEPLSAPGMPEVPLLGCAELVDFSQNETDFDTQWRWEFECRSADPFLRTVEAMNAGGGWTHTVDAPGGNPDYYTDKHHYIADLDGVAFDVDLAAMGEPTELEVTYIVTLAKP